MVLTGLIFTLLAVWNANYYMGLLYNLITTGFSSQFGGLGKAILFVGNTGYMFFWSPIRQDENAIIISLGLTVEREQ